MSTVTTKFLKQEYSRIRREYVIRVTEAGNYSLKDCSGFFGLPPLRLDRMPRELLFLLRVHRSLPNYKKLAVLYHEEGHVYCQSTYCSCVGGDRTKKDKKNVNLCTLSEYHAQLFALKKLYPLFTKSAAYSANYFDAVEDEHQHYHRAQRRLEKTVIWIKCNQDQSKWRRN